MFQVFGLYLAAAGGAAGAQVARGLARGALTEAAGGLAAPVVSAVNQFSLLGADVCRAATSLTAQPRTRADPVTPPLPPRCRQASVMCANGAA